MLVWLAPFLAACSQNKDTPVNHEIKDKGEVMDIQPVSSVSASKIPPMDASVPEVYETATFGLG